eukprot:CAMPEP_0172679582 /NCGR_PEP_ID=MMETSP1074-20121228/16161_1 /TAXON_ID=2916 /ORGANISM="Ceratium fusus, Strain PA161109" /LENGTH=218 /DNA_ID=CAMNT_0013497771 /DNA_START=255 /DNA_END=911 /DNA_ORIENTATION=-
MGGSMALGSVLGPVGAITGAIGGAIVGSQVGAAASDTACDAVEASKGSLCEDCKVQSTNRAGSQNWGGGRLGDDPGTSSTSGYSSGTQQESLGDRASAAATAAGQRVGEGWSRLSKKVSSTFKGGEEEKSANQSGSGAGKNTFVPFAGGGQVLGSGSTEMTRRPSNPSRLVGGGAQPATAAAPVPAAQGSSQIDADEALARQLQEQFFMEDSRQQHGR